jgi:hypothetical protein
MRKLLLRIVALSLVSALAADPVTASTVLSSRSFCDAVQTQIHQGLFGQQALAAPFLSHPILKHVVIPARLLARFFTWKVFRRESLKGFVFESGQPPGDDFLVLIGDLNGFFNRFWKLAQDAGVISRWGSWSGGKATLVQSGDIAAYSSNSIKAWEAMGKLQEEARAVGGKVIRLLGNHEWKMMIGDPEQVDIDGMGFDQTQKLGALIRQDVAEGRVQIAYAVGEFLITHAGIPYLLWDDDIRIKMIARHMNPSDPQEVANYLNSIARAVARPDQKKSAQDWELIEEGFRYVNATVGVDHYAHLGALLISKHRPQITAHDPVEDIGPPDRVGDGWTITVDIGNDEENPKRLGYLTMDRFGQDVRSVLLHKDGRRVDKELVEHDEDPHYSFEPIQPPAISQQNDLGNTSRWHKHVFESVMALGRQVKPFFSWKTFVELWKGNPVTLKQIVHGRILLIGMFVARVCSASTVVALRHLTRTHPTWYIWVAFILDVSYQSALMATLLFVGQRFERRVRKNRREGLKNNSLPPSMLPMAA